MNTTIELLIMSLISQAEEEYQKIKEDAIKGIVKKTLNQLQDNEKISSTEYKEALDILERYRLSNS